MSYLKEMDGFANQLLSQMLRAGIVSDYEAQLLQGDYQQNRIAIDQQLSSQYPTEITEQTLTSALGNFLNKSKANIRSMMQYGGNMVQPPQMGFNQFNPQMSGFGMQHQMQSPYMGMQQGINNWGAPMAQQTFQGLRPVAQPSGYNPYPATHAPQQVLKKENIFDKPVESTVEDLPQEVPFTDPTCVKKEKSTSVPGLVKSQFKDNKGEFIFYQMNMDPTKPFRSFNQAIDFLEHIHKTYHYGKHSDMRYLSIMTCDILDYYPSPFVTATQLRSVMTKLKSDYSACDNVEYGGFDVIKESLSTQPSTVVDLIYSMFLNRLNRFVLDGWLATSACFDILPKLFKLDSKGDIEKLVALASGDSIGSPSNNLERVLLLMQECRSYPAILEKITREVFHSFIMSFSTLDLSADTSAYAYIDKLRSNILKYKNTKVINDIVVPCKETVIRTNAEYLYNDDGLLLSNIKTAQSWFIKNNILHLPTRMVVGDSNLMTTYTVALTMDSCLNLTPIK